MGAVGVGGGIDVVGGAVEDAGGDAAHFEDAAEPHVPVVGGAGLGGGQDIVAVLVGVLYGQHHDGAGIVDAGGMAGLVARLGEGGKQHAGQDRDDGDDDEEFDQGEAKDGGLGLSWDGSRMGWDGKESVFGELNKIFPFS